MAGIYKTAITLLGWFSFFFEKILHAMTTPWIEMLKPLSEIPILGTLLEGLGNILEAVGWTDLNTLQFMFVVGINMLIINTFRKWFT